MRFNTVSLSGLREHLYGEDMFVHIRFGYLSISQITVAAFLQKPRESDDLGLDLIERLNRNYMIRCFDTTLNSV